MKESESELSALRLRHCRRCSHSFETKYPISVGGGGIPRLSLPVILKPHFAITLTKALIKTRRKGRRGRGGRETEPAEEMWVSRQSREGGRPKMELKRYIMTCAMPMPERTAADDASRVSERGS